MTEEERAEFVALVEKRERLIAELLADGQRILELMEKLKPGG